MMTILIPIHDRVIVKRAEADGVSKGGIIIPDRNKDKPQEGIVVSVGPGKHEGGTFVGTQVRKGCKVLFSSFAGHEVTIDEIQYLILIEADILAIIK